MKSGRGQKRPGGDAGRKRKMRKANARTAPGRVNLPGKSVNPAQDRPAQKRISDEGPPGSKRLKVADKMPGAKRKKDPPLPTPQDFCRGDASAETEGTYVPFAAACSAAAQLRNFQGCWHVFHTSYCSNSWASEVHCLAATTKNNSSHRGECNQIW